MVQNGPAITWLQSMTLIPDNAALLVVILVEGWRLAATNLHNLNR